MDRRSFIQAGASALASLAAVPAKPPEPATPIEVLETALLRVALEQDADKFHANMTPYVQNACDRMLSSEARRIFVEAGRVEMVAFVDSFWE